MVQTDDELRMPLTSADLLGERIEALRDIFPEVFTEDQIDFDRLKLALGEHTADGPERYGLTWPGKAEAVRAIQTPSTGTLTPMPEESVNFATADNLIIEGDNLEVLKLLQKSYHGKVKMIYIDPPYNTGNEFIYPDNFREGLQDYLRYSGQVDDGGTRRSTNVERGGRYHSSWLSMMYPRLFLARNLLRQDGVIFVSIDDHEANNLRLMLAEIFGEENFVTQLVVQLNPRGRHLDQFVAKTHEYILVFAKDVTQQTTMYPLAKEGRMLEEYDKEDERGRYREIELRNRNPAFNSRTRPNLYYPLFANPRTQEVALERSSEYSVEIWPKNSSGGDSCWTWSQRKVADNQQLLVSREVAGGGWRVYRKDYLVGEDGLAAGTKPKSLWIDRDINNDYGKKAIQELFGETVMDFPKSPALISRLIRTGNTRSDIVLDFFAGSGTTAQATMELNAEDNGSRKYILVQLPEPTDHPDYPTIADICRERVRRVIQNQDKTEHNGGGQNGFRAFKLTSSNFKVWDADQTPQGAEGLARQLELYADHLLPDRTQQDVLYELILKFGLELTVPIEPVQVGDGTAYMVDGDSLLICLEERLTEEMLRAMVALDPVRVVCLDQAFGGNDQLKTNTALEMKAHNIEFRTV